MYSREHRIAKTSSDSHDIPATNQFAPRPFVVQPQTEQVTTTQQEEKPDLGSQSAKVKQVDDGFPDPAVFTRHLTPPKQPRIQMKLSIGKPGNKYEQEADQVAADVVQKMNTLESSSIQRETLPEDKENRTPVSNTNDNANASKATPSPALALRDTMRISSASPLIQRDIIGNQNLKNGTFDINFKKYDGKKVGNSAREKGIITFTPNAKAPASNSIRFVQIVNTTDTTGVSSKAGEPVDWSKIDSGQEAPRNQMLTEKAKNVAAGFFVDQEAAVLKKRTKKADPAVSPYYDAAGSPILGNVIGSAGKTIKPATLVDAPGTPKPMKFDFVTSAKASDNGTWYGSVVWTFETYLDQGKTKIKNEKHSFREARGATTDAALKKFNEYYRNPGASTAPKK